MLNMKPKYDEESFVKKVTEEANRYWIVREIKHILRHPHLVVNWLWHIGTFIVLCVVIYFGWQIYSMFFRPDIKVPIGVKGTDFEIASPVRLSKFRKMFPDKKIPVPLPDKSYEFKQIIKVKGEGYLGTFTNSDKVVHSKSVKAKVTNMQRKWGFCFRPKLIGMLHKEGGDTGLSLKVFRINRFGINLSTVSEGAGLGFSYKPSRRFKNTSIEAGGLIFFDGGKTPYVGIAVEF